MGCSVVQGLEQWPGCKGGRRAILWKSGERLPGAWPPQGLGWRLALGTHGHWGGRGLDWRLARSHKAQGGGWDRCLA